MWSQKRRVSSPPVYDVVIVGSGAAGGTAAWVLVQAGLKVAMLDAGPLRKHLEDFPYHDPWPYDDPYRGLKGSTDNPDEFTKKYKIEGNSKDEPYTTPEKMPYDWFRARNVGGRTMFWGRFANRFNETDFKMRSTDGQGLDWPIEYKDLATGTFKAYEEIKAEIPETVLDLLKVEGVGMKTLQILYNQFQISNLEDFAKFVAGGGLSNVSRLGEKAQDRIRASLTRLLPATGSRKE